MSRGVSSIYGHGPAEPVTGSEADARNFEVCRDLWQRKGIATFIPSMIPGEWDRLEIEALAIKHYGKRR